jgi:ABC-type Fe3+ transport system substrate-binding protein
MMSDEEMTIDDWLEHIDAFAAMHGLLPDPAKYGAVYWTERIHEIIEQQIDNDPDLALFVTVFAVSQLIEGMLERYTMKDVDKLPEGAPSPDDARRALEVWGEAIKGPIVMPVLTAIASDIVLERAAHNKG